MFAQWRITQLLKKSDIMKFSDKWEERENKVIFIKEAHTQTDKHGMYYQGDTSR